MQLSIAERDFIVKSLSQTPCIRPDGRDGFQFRPIALETDIMPSAHGSARIVMGNTECIVVIKADVSDADIVDGKPFGRVSCSVECVQSGNLHAREDDMQTISLTDILEQTLSPSVQASYGIDKSKLAITKTKAWSISIDGLVMSADTYPIEALSLCARAAVLSARLPETEAQNSINEMALDVDKSILHIGARDDDVFKVNDDWAAAVPMVAWEDRERIPIVVVASLVKKKNYIYKYIHKCLKLFVKAKINRFLKHC